MNINAKKYIEKLQLKKHPEGGYYKEIYRSGELIEAGKLPPRYKSSRVFSTSIYFLLQGTEFSAFHRLKSDETWHFYDGSSVILYKINADGELLKIRIGSNTDDGEIFQFTVPALEWFAAELINKKDFALLGCTVAPGFDFNDFETGSREELTKTFPQHSDIIKRLTM